MVAGDADLVSARSALACTGKVTVPVLLPGFESVVVEDAVAALVSAVVRSAATSVSIVIRAWPTVVRVPRVQATAPPVTVQVPWVVLADRTVNPVTAGSDTVTPCA